MMSDEEDFDCPLCMEELDISDRNFRPCPCGYQICRFCWHHIKEDLNGRCPACRRVYSEETIEFTPISADELAMIKNEKKAKEREKKEMEAMNRKHLSNMRVVQKSLVYVIGLPSKLANDEHTLRQHEYFGQYGKISKVVINRRNAPMPVPGSSPGLPSVGVYITYVRKEDAAKAIAAIDGSIWDGKILRASYGTTKYCTYYLRGMSCQNPGCMYLHEPGEDADSYTKEDLAVGKHHLQEHMVPYDPYIHKPAALGRPPLPSHASSSSASLTPRPKPATVASYHSATSSLSDWPAPGGRSDDKEEEGSALPATASWAKIGSNPSTPTLLSSTLSRKSEGPPPLRSKGSTASIITGVVVNNGKRKELNYTRDGSAMDMPIVDSPTPAEALAIEAAAKQQMLLEQRQQQEQHRKQQLLLQKQQQQQQEETELQTELLNQKLKKQKQLELEQEQAELQKQKQQQEMEAKMQKQKEKEQLKKEQQRKEQLQKEKELQEQKERELQAQKEQELKEKEAREEKERQEREVKERKEREEREEREEKERKEAERKAEKEREEQEAARLAQLQAESMFVTAPPLSLGSFSFNPDASLATLPYSFGNPNETAPLGPEARGSFGLGTYSGFGNMPMTPGHYTGSFNPFSMDDEPLMRRPMAPPARPFLDDSDYDPSMGRDRPVGPPIPGKPRQTSRFGFAMDNQYGDSFNGYPENSGNMQSMQDGLRALFPNVNVSFGSANVQQQQQQQQQQLQQQQQSHHEQQQQQQRQPSLYQTSPLLQRQDILQGGGMWDGADKQEGQAFQRSMGQLNMDPMLTTPSSRMAEYHQQLLMQQHGQRSAPPGITRNSLTPSMVKSPPPGLESSVRTELPGWSGSQQQQQQPQQQQSSRMNNWGGDTSNMNSGLRGSQENAQDFFGAFLKAASQTPTSQPGRPSVSSASQGSLSFQDPAIMSVRMSSSGSAKPSLVEALQHPSLSGYPSFNMNHESMQDAGHRGEMEGSGPQDHQRQRQQAPDSPSLAQFPLGSKRKEVKSVKGVLNSGMNAPLSRQSSNPGSPQVEPRMQQHFSPMKSANIEPYPMSFGMGESPMMNMANTAAARSAKVKSDLLMGLNAGLRSERFSKQEPASEDSSVPGMNNMRMNNAMHSPYNGPDYASRSSQYEGLNMNNYGSGMNNLNMPMSSGVSGPPPGLGIPPGGSMQSNGGNGSYMVPGLGDRSDNGSNGMYMNNKPLDVTSMMSALDMFGPGQSNSLLMSPNWSLPNGGGVNGSLGMHHHDMNARNQGLPRRDSAQSNNSAQYPGHSNHVNNNHMSNTSASNHPNGNPNNNSNTMSNSPMNLANANTSANASSNMPPNGSSDNSNSGANTDHSTPSNAATARSVEDLELQVINAKLETQMLENQLNAVIKRNRRKIYA